MLGLDLFVGLPDGSLAGCRRDTRGATHSRLAIAGLGRGTTLLVHAHVGVSRDLSLVTEAGQPRGLPFARHTLLRIDASCYGAGLAVLATSGFALRRICGRVQTSTSRSSPRDPVKSPGLVHAPNKTLTS